MRRRFSATRVRSFRCVTQAINQPFSTASTPAPVPGYGWTPEPCLDDPICRRRVSFGSWGSGGAAEDHALPSIRRLEPCGKRSERRPKKGMIIVSAVSEAPRRRGISGDRRVSGPGRLPPLDIVGAFSEIVTGNGTPMQAPLAKNKA
jgi:hypothetical protein